jgi:predicted RNA binding protein YcfA (HicA-like mRNA interferase family)
MSDKFPVDAPIKRVLTALELLGFAIVRKGNHIALSRKNADGTSTPLTLPNHKTIKSSTLHTICTQSGISREDFIKNYQKA